MASDSSVRPFVIGIVGPSGCGKSSLATSLRAVFDGVLFSEDPKYFKAPAAESYQDRDPASETPTSVDWDAYVNDLHSMIHRADVHAFFSSVLSRESLAAPASSYHSVVLVEHFLLLHDERVAKELDALLFLEPYGSDEEAMNLCMERRVNRNSNRSAEEAEHLRSYYRQHVWPCYQEYSRSQARSFCEDNSCKESRPRAIRIDCRIPLMDILDQVRFHVEEWMGRPYLLGARR